MSPKSRSAKRRSRAFGLNLVAVGSEMVVLKWCSPYYKTLSDARCAKFYAGSCVNRSRPSKIAQEDATIRPLEKQALDTTDGLGNK
jgi:hypothetical protein